MLLLTNVWHRLGHLGEKVTGIIHKHVQGVPKLRQNQFYCCDACMVGKFHNIHIGNTKSSSLNNMLKNLPENLQQQIKDHVKKEKAKESTTTKSDKGKVGQHLHMDFGFVRGSDWSKKLNDGKLVTSVDKYRCYLLVIDKASRYIWIYLTRTKQPPFQQVDGLLKLWRGKFKHCTVTTDQGKELGTSIAFKKMVK